MDPQAHASLHLGVEPQPGEPSVYDVLVGATPLADARRQVGENLWLVPSHVDLATAEMEMSRTLSDAMQRQEKLHENGRPQLDHLFTVLREKVRDDPQPPEFLLIDCPPSLGVLTLNALVAAREVLIPLQPHFLALHGLSKLLETIDLIARGLNPRLRLAGVVLCMYESSTRLAGEVTADVEEFFQAARGEKTPWAGARVFDDPRPPQRPPGRGAELRAVDFQVCAQLERSGGLSAVGGGNSVDGRRGDRESQPGRRI